LEMVIRPGSEETKSTNGQAAGSAEVPRVDPGVPSIPAEEVESRLEFADEAGRPIAAFPEQIQSQGRELRLRYALPLPEELGEGDSAPASFLRLYGLTTAKSEVSFEMHDLRMP